MAQSETIILELLISILSSETDSNFFVGIKISGIFKNDGTYHIHQTSAKDSKILLAPGNSLELILYLAKAKLNLVILQFTNRSAMSLF